MFQSYQIIHCTCPDQEIAEQLAHGLINEKLAACVNIIPCIYSIYPWQGKIASTQEYLLLIKTQKHLFKQVACYIRKHHPYDLPEIVAVPINQGSPEYLQWIDTCLASK